MYLNANKNRKKAQVQNNKHVKHKLSSASQIFKNSNSKVLTATLCLLTIVVLSTITGGFGSFKSIVRADSVKGVGVGIYWDQTCTNTTLAFQFGQIQPGSNKTLTVYVKNGCSSPVLLMLETSNWNPSSSRDYISLDWNYSSQVLNANEVIPLEITLLIDTSIYGISNFNFNTNIVASQY
jgi:hypothetical protein